MTELILEDINLTIGEKAGHQSAEMLESYSHHLSLLIRLIYVEHF